MNSTNNPLSSHFRQPVIYLELPSRGQFWPEGTLDLPATGEIPVYPATIRDEIMLKTPDALLNGSSVTELIASCCPSIQNPWKIPATDIDAILIAIRIASYGNDMDISTTCPHCKNENESTVNLNVLLDNLQPIVNYADPEQIGKLSVEFQPQTYEIINQTNITTFEQQKLIANIIESDLSEQEKKEHFAEGFKQLADLNVEILTGAVAAITTEQGVRVTEPVFIKEFLSNCDKKVYDKIKERSNQLARSNTVDPVALECEQCNHQYTSKLEFEQSNFFG